MASSSKRSYVFILIFIVILAIILLGYVLISGQGRNVQTAVQMSPVPTINDSVSYSNDSQSQLDYRQKVLSIWADAQNSTSTAVAILSEFPQIDGADEYRYDTARLGILDYAARMSAIEPPEDYRNQHEKIVLAMENSARSANTFERGFSGATQEGVTEILEVLRGESAQIDSIVSFY